MGSLLLVLFVMGVALPRVHSSSMPQAKPVPKPTLIGVGHRTVNVTLTTNIDYKLCQDGSSCKFFFINSQILAYSKAIGDIGDMNSVIISKTADDGMAYIFSVQNADCQAVKFWMNQIVQSSPVFVSANVQCVVWQRPTLPMARPVEKPKVRGRGSRSVGVTLTTDTVYNVCQENRSSCQSSFINSKILDYAKFIGDVGDINSVLMGKTSDDVLAYVFAIHNTDCKAVISWMKLVVFMNRLFISANVQCQAPPTLPPAQPVPKPEVIGRGTEALTIILYTNIGYEACERDRCLRFFNDTKISEYSKPLGDFEEKYLRALQTTDDNLAYSLIIANADCKTVKLWMNQIVPSSPIYESADVQCSKPFPPQPPSLEIKPVPKPAKELIGKGSDLVLVEIQTIVMYNPGSYFPDYYADEYFSYFDLTKIKEYTQLLGEFGILEVTSSDNYLVYRLEIKKTVCEKVALWLKEIVNSSSFYKRINTTGGNGLDCTYLITNNACRVESLF